jgi:hypothetical protein
MSGVATAIVGAAVVGGVASSRAASSAAKAQSRGAKRGIDEQRRQFDLSRSDLAPWRQVGAGALNTLANDFGNSFQTSPGYEFVRREGQRDLGNSFASRGGAFSGNALRALDQYNTGLASQEYGNWWNRGAGLAGIGQNAVNTGVMAGQNSANNISNLYNQQGDARASGIMGQANSISGALNTGLNNWMLYRGGYFNAPAKPPA